MCFAGTGVSVFSLHPGVVQSDLWRHQHQCIQVAVKIFKLFTKTTVEGAQTTIYCAVEPDLERQSGGYFRYRQHLAPIFAGCARAVLLILRRAVILAVPNVCSNATQHVMAIVCPSLCCACSVTVPPRAALGWPLTTTWVKNCGRSAAACWASPGSDTWQHKGTVHKQFFSPLPLPGRGAVVAGYVHNLC